MLRVLRQRNFALLWSGGLISIVGTWALYTALPFYVYQETRSALATGAMFAAQIVPRIALASLAGVVVDRWDRRRAMILADLSRALILLPLLAVRSTDDFWIVYVVAFAEATISQFFDPAASALVPHLVDEPSLPAANALNAMIGPLNRLIAPALGGILLALLGLTSVVLADSASYVASAALLVLVRVPPLPPGPARGRAESSAFRSLWREWRDGARLVLGESVLRTTFLIAGVVLIGYGMVTVVLVLFVEDVLQRGALVFGWIVAAQGIGGLLGAAGYGVLRKIWSPGWLIALSLLPIGSLYLLVISLPVVPIVVTLVAVLGVPVTCFWISTTLLLQTRAPRSYQGRVFGGYGTLNSLATLLGVGLAGVATNLVGVVPAFGLAAGFYLLGGAIALTVLVGAERRATSLPVRASG